MVKLGSLQTGELFWVPSMGIYARGSSFGGLVKCYRHVVTAGGRMFKSADEHCMTFGEDYLVETAKYR